MFSKFIRFLVVFGAISLVALTAGRAANAQALYVYANCRNSPCTIGVAIQSYAFPNNARYREGWRKLRGPYNSGTEAWRVACRLHYARNRYRSPDIINGNYDCASVSNSRPSTRWVRGCGQYRYSGQIRRIYVPQDRRRYGSCREWGGRWTAGSSYAGYRNLPTGAFWVWRAPYWYLYRNRTR
jgi:hypothetical protein